MRDAPRRYIGTFHKTGTALFESILRAAGAARLVRPWFMHETVAVKGWDIAFDYHTETLLQRFDVDPSTSRYVVSVRDPRDLIISATYYHSRADEKWLHAADPNFGGMSYHEKINSFATMKDRFFFEMENSSDWAIRSMLRVPLDAPSLFLTRFETLVTDYELVEFQRIFAFLEVEARRVPRLLNIAHSQSLFSGNVGPSTHVRSGKPAQYLKEFDDEVLARYYSIFGDAALRLGYPA